MFARQAYLKTAQEALDFMIMDTQEFSLVAGQTIIRRYVKELPLTPGVYRMLDVRGEALYIGKAKNLQQRVAYYANAGAVNTRLQRMIAQTMSMEFTVARSEAEALLLEANLIKKYAPRYNVLLKDDKSFPYIFFSGDHAYPRISKYRGPKTKKGKYFGPFVSAHAVDETIALLQKAFLLRPCADTVFKHRTRPCLQYQIKRCSAPCVNKISPEEYKRLVAQAQTFLSGKSRDIQEALIAEMQGLSLAMHYEKASAVRDRLKALTAVQQQGDVAALGDADVIVLARQGQHCAVQLFSYRGGRNYGNRTWFPLHAEDVPDAEVMGQFIGQYYQTQPIPPTVLVSHLLDEVTVLEDALAMNAGHKVDVILPLRGAKREAVAQAAGNARLALTRHLSLKLSEQAALVAVQQLFGLEELPARIEVYDNSHISGVHAVGAMIVAGPEGFCKNEYRKFNVALTHGGDDYAMLREVLMRRFRHVSEEDGKRPDLVLIDGGAGQLSVATQVFEELGLSGIVYAGIAKGEDRRTGHEWIHWPGQAPFQLPEHDAALHYLQRLRDEAHRFAIGTHRNKRSKSLQVSELDRIEGIGPMRKKALLTHFGSVKALSGTSIEDLQKAPGINRAMAERIFAHFHGQ